MANSSISMDSLIREFGKAILDAQSQLNTLLPDQQPGPDGNRLAVVIRDTDVDVKLLFGDDSETVTLRPVTVADSRAEGFDARALSSLKATLTAVPDDQERPPARSADEVSQEVLNRPDVMVLKPILGELAVKPTYVSGLKKWIVDVTEPGGEIVRSIQVSDIVPSPAPISPAEPQLAR